MNHLPKCRACGNEPESIIGMVREIEYSLGTVPYATVWINVPSCGKCGRWVMTPEAKAQIAAARNEHKMPKEQA